MRNRLLVIAILLVFLPARWAFGASQAVTDYTHDTAGNTTKILTEANTQPPSVTALDPNAVRRIATNRITAYGDNLKNAQVSSAEAGFQIATVETQTDRIVFDFTAAETVVPGDYPLTFANRLGTATATLTVKPDLPPELQAYPDPITVGKNGDTVKLHFTLSAPDSVANTLYLSVADPTIAQVSPSEIVIDKGATSSSQTVTVTGMVEGQTELAVNASQLNNLHIPVNVIAHYQFPPGDHTITSATLGIDRAFPPAKPVQGDQAYTPTLGLIRAFPAAKPINGDNAYTSALGIVREAAQATPVKGDAAYASTLGIVREPAQAAPVKADNAYTQIGLFWGSTIDSVTPAVLIAGDINPLNLFGENLHWVTAIALEPADGALVDPAFEVSPDHTQLTVHISIASGTPASQRKLVVTTSKGPAEFTQTDGDKVDIQ
jgi:hypothetical protein